MNLPCIPLLLVALLLADTAVLMEGSTTALPPSPSTPPTPLLPLSATPSSPSIETQPLLQSSLPSSSSASPSSTPTTSPPPPPPTTTTRTWPVLMTRTVTSDSGTVSWYWVPPTEPSTTTTTTTTDTTTTPAYSTCPESDQIHCGTTDRCTRIRYICDGDNDCGDNTDEASSLCAAWTNNDCERNLAKCTRLGRTDCVTISNYCSQTNPPCEGPLDMRLCVMLRDGKIQPLHTLQLPTTTPTTTEPPTTHIPIHVMEAIWSDDFEQKLTHTISHPDCPQLYTRVGNLCLSVFFIGNMTWLESRAFCRAIGGDLFSLSKDLAPFTTLLQHLAVNGVTADFWIGGRYVNETTGWTWVDDTPLTMGSPFWAVRYKETCTTRSIPYLNSTQPANDGACYHYEQAPPAFTARHCIAATYQHYFYLTDENCFSKKSPLCVMPGEKKQQAH